MSHKCNSSSCNNCNALRKKLDVYEKFVNDIRDIDQFDDKDDNAINILEESVIFEKDKDGNLEKKIRSDLTESILVIDKCKNINDLYKKDQDIIKEQDNLASYNKLVNCSEKATGVYTAGSIILSIARFALFL